MSVLPAPQFPPVVGETGGQRIARIVKAYVGCSLAVRREDLAALVGRGIDDESIVTWETNCCTFFLGVLTAAGLDFPALKVPLKNGEEFGVLVAIGDHFNAWRVPAPSELIPEGAGLWYHVSGKNVDHVEAVLAPPDGHGGGGRTNNAIEEETGDLHWGAGRPLYKWLDPSALQLPDAMASDGGDPVGDPLPSEAPTRPSLIPPPLPFDPVTGDTERPPPFNDPSSK